MRDEVRRGCWETDKTGWIPVCFRGEIRSVAEGMGVGAEAKVEGSAGLSSFGLTNPARGCSADCTYCVGKKILGAKSERVEFVIPGERG